MLTSNTDPCCSASRRGHGNYIPYEGASLSYPRGPGKQVWRPTWHSVCGTFGVCHRSTNGNVGGSYLHNGLYEMAAAYLFHLVQNHPFFDGNKRVGAVSSEMFLRLNGIVTNAPLDEYEALVLGVASGIIRKPEIALFFEKYATFA